MILATRRALDERRPVQIIRDCAEEVDATNARTASDNLGVLEHTSLLFAKSLQWICHSRA